MAISIIAAPSGTPSVHDGLWHIVASDNSGQTDFKYVFDIWIGGEQKIRVKQFPEPSNGQGYFDAGPTVRNYMNYEWFEPINSSVLVAEPDMSGEIGISYALRIGEDYSGTTTLNMASGEVSGYNWAPPMFKRRVTDWSDKLNRWLTNRGLVSTVDDGENYFIPFLTEYPDEDVILYVRTYNHSNTLVSDVSGLLAAAPLLSGALQLNIGTTAVFNQLSVTIDDSIKYYEVALWQASPGEHPKMTVYLKCNPKYTCIPVHFLNRWGMWDSMRFDLASRLSMDIERKGFSQSDYRLNTSSVDYMSTANRYYEGKANYSNKATWTYKLNADAMSDNDFEWAAELMVSPQILLEIDEYFYPATIKKSSYDYIKYVNDKLKPLEIEFELNSERYTQLR